MQTYRPKIQRILSVALPPKGVSTFYYQLSSTQRDLIGLLPSNNVELSISFINGRDIELHSYEIAHKGIRDIAPKNRIIHFREDLAESSILIGSVKNMDIEIKTVSLYLITQNPYYEK